MSRPLSRIAPEWWDYTTLDAEIIRDAAAITLEDLPRLSRPGFQIVLHDSLEDFYLAEALEYISAWRQATADDPVGICGPIGPTEQLPLVARLVNELELDLRHSHFWGMDEWFEDGRDVPVTHPLSFERADRELCFDRIRADLRMPEFNLHFPKSDIDSYVASWSIARCAVITMVPTMAISVGPRETWRAEKVSIWHAGTHDNPLGQRLTAMMISKRIVDSSVPMSLLADHPCVQFHYFRGGFGSCAVAMH